MWGRCQPTGDVDVRRGEAMGRLESWLIALVLLVGLATLPVEAQEVERNPDDDLPDDTTDAVIVSVVDGDTIKVRITEEDHPEEGEVVTVRLIGVDTPETRDPNDPVECYGAEATKRTKQMLPKGRTVYLEADVTDEDRYDRLLRYVWFEGKQDGKAYLANELLVAEGYAVVSTFPPDVKYVERFTDAQDEAVEEERGLWPACGGADTPLGEEPAVAADPDEPLVADCSPFASYEEAQTYYAEHPEAQPVIDPNADGRACEVWFEVDQAPAAPPVDPGGAPTAGCDPSYPGVCIPPYPPDLDCGQVGVRGFAVAPPDPHGFDGDGDGVGCES